MKRLLILISILLLLGCVKNQGTEFLYQYKTSSGVIFKSIGDGKVQPKYKGEITNGKPSETPTHHPLSHFLWLEIIIKLKLFTSLVNTLIMFGKEIKKP